MSEQELKPCPFCGSKAKYTYHSNANLSGWQYFADHWVYCDNDKEGVCAVHQGMFETKEQAITAWNTRHASLKETP